MILRYVVFFGIALLIIGGGHVYLYRRLFRDTTHDPRIRVAGRLGLAILGVVLIGGRIMQRTAPGLTSDIVGGIGYVWMGLALFLVLGFLVADAVHGLRRLSARVRSRFGGSGGDGVVSGTRGAVVDAIAGAAAGGISQAGASAGDRIASAAGLLPSLDGARSSVGGPHLPQSTDDSVDASRRLFLARASAGTAAVVASGVAGYGAWRAYHPPEISEVVVKVPKLPRALDGFTIVQLSDIHVGNMIEKRFLEELVRRANSAKPDLLAITGDLVDGDVDTLAPSVAALRGIHARYGAYFVTGNHEYYSGVEPWAAFLPSVGVNVLRNRRVTIGDAGGSLELVGVDDWSGGKSPGHGDYDLDRALQGKSPDAATVLLAHQPSNFDVARTKGVDLQLSGHTHGGQLFPMTMLIGLGWEYSAGHYQRGDSHIYVSRGCGFWGPPMRVGSPPEIVKVILTT